MKEITKIGLVCIVALLLIAAAFAGGVYVGVFKGEKGEKGAIGTQGVIGPQGIKGDKGDTGAQGIPGINAPINKLPVVSLKSMTGLWSECWSSYRSYYIINVNVDDPEDDKMHITFYYKWGITDTDWNEVKEYINGDGDYSATVYFSVPCHTHPSTLYWLVEAWDGSDISLTYFTQTFTSMV